MESSAFSNIYEPFNIVNIIIIADEFEALRQFATRFMYCFYIVLVHYCRISGVIIVIR